MKSNPHSTISALTLVFVIPLFYVGAYFALLNPSPPFVEPEKGNFVLRSVGFRLGGRFSETAFWPLIKLDHRVRPEFWCDLTEKGKRWGDAGP
jgi:hypothetical protein